MFSQNTSWKPSTENLKTLKISRKPIVINSFCTLLFPHTESYNFHYCILSTVFGFWSFRKPAKTEKVLCQFIDGFLKKFLEWSKKSVPECLKDKRTTRQGRKRARRRKVYWDTKQTLQEEIKPQARKTVQWEIQFQKSASELEPRVERTARILHALEWTTCQDWMCASEYQEVRKSWRR